MKKTVLILFLLAITIRLIFIYQLKANQSFPFNALYLDPLYYHTWAKEIANGDLIGQNRIFDLSPLYAYFLAIIYKLTGDNLTYNLLSVRIIQSILGAFICIFVYLIARKIYSNRIGIIASILTVFYSPLIYYDGLLKKTTLGIFLTLLSILILLYPIRLSTHPSIHLSIFISGLLLGLSALVTSNNLILVPFVLMWIVWEARNQKSESPLPSFNNRRVQNEIILLFCFLIGIILAIAPVTIRNRIVNDDWILIDTGGGPALYIGTVTKTGRSTSTSEFGRPAPQYAHNDFREEAKLRTGNPNLKPSQSSAFWMKESIKVIFSNPVDYAKILWKKFILFWNVYEVPCNENFYFFKRFAGILNLPLLHFGIVTPFGILGMIIAFINRKNFKREFLLYAFVIIYMISILPFFIYSRLRIPIVPFLIIFGGYGINWILDTGYWILDTSIKHQASSIKYQASSIKYQQIFKFIIALLFLITLFFGINRTIIPYKDNFDYSYYNYGAAFANNGEYKKAIEYFEEALKISPYYKDALKGRVMAYNGLGRTYIQKGDWNNALDALTKSIIYDSTYSPAFHNIGIVYKNLGKYDLAINNFERAILLKEKASDPVSVRIQSSLSELALLYEEKGEYNKAYNCWKKILEYSPNDEVERARKHILELDSKK